MEMERNNKRLLWVIIATLALVTGIVVIAALVSNSKNNNMNDSSSSMSPSSSESISESLTNMDSSSYISLTEENTSSVG